jgi:hypothetical protein
MNNNLKQLKEALEGKTVLEILPGEAVESICRFVLSNNKTYRLYATDLGFWIEETKGSNGYPSLKSLVQDYSAYTYNDPYVERDSNGFYHKTIPFVSLNETLLNIIAPNGKTFSIEINKLSDSELKIIDDPVGCILFAKNIEMGEDWQYYIELDENCPKELKELK